MSVLPWTPWCNSKCKTPTLPTWPGLRWAGSFLAPCAGHGGDTIQTMACVLFCLLFLRIKKSGLTPGPAGSAMSIPKCILLPSSEKCLWSKPSIWDQKEKGDHGVKYLSYADMGVLSEPGDGGPAADHSVQFLWEHRSYLLLQALWGTGLLPPIHLLTCKPYP